MDRVLGLLEGERWEEALQALLAAWREVRAPELEAAIDAMSAWIAPVVPAVPPGDDAFHERARRDRAVDLPALLLRLLDRPVGSVPGRVRALLVRAPDPRLGQALLPMIDAPPTTASSNFGMWTAIFDALPGLVDQRAADRLRARAAVHGGSSQFWPKLTRWIEAAVSELPPPATLDPPLVPGVRAIQRRIAAIVEGPPSFPPLAAVPGPDLSYRSATIPSALQAARDDDLEAALDALVGVWSACRAPAVGDAIDRLGGIVDQRRPALPRGGALQAAWMAAGEAARPSDVGALLEVWRDGKWPQVELRMSLMRRWAPDPRVCRAMVALTGDFMVGARRSMWASAYDLLVHHADPRLAEDVLGLHRRLQGPRDLHRRAAMGRESDRVIDAFRAEVGRPTVLLPADEAALIELTAHLGRLAGSACAGDLERGLVDAIVAAPDDDGPRLVYADWLRECGRVRGEFVALDVALSAGQKVRGKRDKLLKSDREGALGPMAAVLGSRTRIERGFVVEADLRLGQGALVVTEDQRRAILEDPGWRTVRSLRAWDGPGPVLAGSPLDSLREVRGRASLDDLLAAAVREVPLPVVSVALAPRDDEPDERWARLDDLVRALPDLRHLDVMIWAREGGRATPPVRFFASALVARLERITCGDGSAGGRSDVGAWLDRLTAAGSPVPRVELVGPHVAIALDRAEDGRYGATVTATVRMPRQAEEVAAWLANVDRSRLSSVALALDGDAADVLRAALDAR
jgi:uncharacterized protein (TIGR02996 family)